jgi:hypothetical protein
MKFIKEFNTFKEIDLLTDKSIQNLDKELIMSLLFKSVILSSIVDNPFISKTSESKITAGIWDIRIY